MEGFCETPQISIMVLKHIEINYQKTDTRNRVITVRFDKMFLTIFEIEPGVYLLIN